MGVLARQKGGKASEMSRKDRKKGLTEYWQGLFLHLRVGGEGNEKGRKEKKKSSLLSCGC